MVFTFPAWIQAIPFVLAGAALLAAGLAQWKLRFAPVTVSFVCGAVFMAVVVGPMLTRDRVVVTDDKVEQTTGFWWSPTVKGFAFDGVARVVVADGWNDRDQRQELWTVERTDGTTVVIDPGDLWELHGDAIADALRARGVSVERR